MVGFWHNKQVFITGHTGFKGAWLTATLLKLGAKVTGYSVDSQPLFDELGLATKITHIKADICDRARIAAEIVLHMAAQSLVRYSYQHPLQTFDANFTGTLNVLEGVRQAGSVKALVVITTDKCYQNLDTGRLFKEDDALGGKDPYSASKAAAEIVTSSYYQSFLKDAGIPTASARAGNVIGGGDWAQDRLIPDVIRSIQAGKAVSIRSPKATRPWQFVLEPLSGYMLLAERLYNDGHKFSGGWNFGPEETDIKPVEDVMNILRQTLDFKLELDSAPQPTEAKLLALSIEKAKRDLGWQPKLNLAEAVGWTGAWYKAFLEGKNITAEQIDRFFA